MHGHNGDDVLESIPTIAENDDVQLQQRNVGSDVHAPIATECSTVRCNGKITQRYPQQTCKPPARFIINELWRTYEIDEATMKRP